MKVAIVHDDLVQWGGAERVLDAICETYPEAPIYTSVFDRSNKLLSSVEDCFSPKNKVLAKKFGQKKIITSFLQKIPWWRRIYKPLMPLYPIAFEQFDFSEYDLVISHTTRFAKSIITKPSTIHICYCHTPPRFLWNFSGEKPPLLLRPFLGWFRRYDQISGKRPDYYLAGSKNAKERIKNIYGMESKVLYPFVDLERFKNIESFEGGYFVVIARLNKYKRVDLAVKACEELGVFLKVIGTGPELETLKRLPRTVGPRNDSGIEFLGNLSDEMVAKVLSGAKALIVPGIEDFGITPLEAEALGKPVIAYKAGGALETVIDNQTGIFFEEQNMESLVEAIKKLDEIKIDPEKCRENAERFSKEKFINNLKEITKSLSFP